ncbi:hypothetical protein NDU88_002377 [Pleurodeles waltl]|uniref:Uncharacterized protein n=1 Tax=Pleurodeles waltl TaxID=8319 RepID=A0AAV7KUL4_PLEWA|nr:hypothetical protein NDU88_002377 [Pleurodeles waltl]
MGRGTPEVYPGGTGGRIISREAGDFRGHNQKRLTLSEEGTKENTETNNEGRAPHQEDRGGHNINNHERRRRRTRFSGAEEADTQDRERRGSTRVRGQTQEVPGLSQNGVAQLRSRRYVAT